MNAENYKYTRYHGLQGQSRWADVNEVRSCTKKIKLSDKNYEYAGIPMLNDGETAYVDANDNHSLIFGSTGSKKTRLFCMPTLQIIIGAGESFVATDPKGELYDKTSGAAKANGYNVVVLNYRDLNKSDTWNPLALPYKLYHEGDKEAAISRMNDFVCAISEDQMNSTKDIFWVNAARSVALSILILMLDGCTLDECNLKTFTRFCIEFSKGTSASDKLYAQAAGIDSDDLEKNYLNELMDITPKDCIARLNYEGIAKSSDKAKGDIQSTLFTLIGVFMNQEALVRNMCYNSFNLEAIGQEKTAVYIIVPDERTSYHFIATTFIKQCYECLIIQAQATQERQLAVRVNFVLDEFANIPAIPDMPAMISAARSRNMRFFLVLQSMHQLKQKYNENAETIKGNCENWVFLSSKELDILNEISTLCGTVYSYAGNEVIDRPLISVSQLQRLNKQKGEALILCGRQYPIITEMADIDSCAFKKYSPFPLPIYSKINVISISPHTLYNEFISDKRHWSFSSNEVVQDVEKDYEDDDLDNNDIDTLLKETLNLSIGFEDTKVFVLGQYDILQNDDKELLFDIRIEEDSRLINPKFYYDGGEHGILVDDNGLLVICDYIHRALRQEVYASKEVMFCINRPLDDDEECQDESLYSYMISVIKQDNVSLVAEKLRDDLSLIDL